VSGTHDPSRRVGRRNHGKVPDSPLPWRTARTASSLAGNHIDYADNTAFTATGDVRDGVLFHEHLVLYREGAEHTR
jgi:hypothetical protein